jgi:hypothetical protein
LGEQFPLLAKGQVCREVSHLCMVNTFFLADYTRLNPTDSPQTIPPRARILTKRTLATHFIFIYIL